MDVDVREEGTMSPATPPYVLCQAGSRELAEADGRQDRYLRT